MNRRLNRKNSSLLITHYSFLGFCWQSNKRVDGFTMYALSDAYNFSIFSTNGSVASLGNTNLLWSLYTSNLVRDKEKYISKRFFERLFVGRIQYNLLSST